MSNSTFYGFTGRMYNLREKFTALDDTLPSRFFAQAVDAGRLAGSRLDRGRVLGRQALLLPHDGMDRRWSAQVRDAYRPQDRMGDGRGTRVTSPR